MTLSDAAILADYDRRIAAARKRREGLSGQRVWKTRTPPARFANSARADFEDSPLTAMERDIVVAILANGPMLTGQLAKRLGHRRASITRAVQNAADKLKAAGIPVKFTVSDGHGEHGYGRRLTFPAPDAVRSYLGRST